MECLELLLLKYDRYVAIITGTWLNKNIADDVVCPRYNNFRKVEAVSLGLLSHVLL